MNIIKQMKRHSLRTLLVFEKLYADIEAEAKEAQDPRINDHHGVSEQLQAIRDAIYEIRTEKGIPIPNVTVGCQTVELQARRGIDIKE